jgi:UDP-N-acetyl-2-amino-2-deoxyglucuronate dehydrogenase
MNKFIRFGIVGCGVIAETHAGAIDEISDAQLSACCDIIPERSTSFAKKHNISLDHAHVSLSSFLADSAIDAVSVCTPSGTHSEIAVAALTAGKPVIVEKPMDVTVDACMLLKSVQQETGLPVAVVSQHRYDASSVYAHELVHSGGLGNIIFCEAQVKWFRTQDYYDSADWRGTWELDGGGALMNQGIHTVDLMLWMMGDVETVFAVARTAVHQRIEVEDVLCATVTFSSGAVGNIVASTAAYPGFPAQLSVHGTKGSVVISGDALVQVSLTEPIPEDENTRALLVAGAAGHAVHVAQGGTRIAEQLKLDRQIEATSQWGDAHRAQLIDFIDSVRTGRESRANCETGMTAVQLIVAAYESARTGRIVRLR